MKKTLKKKEYASIDQFRMALIEIDQEVVKLEELCEKEDWCGQKYRKYRDRKDFLIVWKNRWEPIYKQILSEVCGNE